MRSFILSVVFALCAAVASAQSIPLDSLTPALPTAGQRHVADIASAVTVAAAIAFDTKASWDSPNRARAFELQGVRLGLTYGASQLVKMLVHRQRPCAPSNTCGIDTPDASFYSMHTAFAFETLGGPRLAVALPLSIGTGGLRIAANKHWLSDVLVGAAVGAATSRIR